MDYKIFWTEEALRNLEEILDYLSTKWTQKEVDNFKLRLSNQLNVILGFPFIFPKSERHPRLRKAVLSKQTIVFYEIRGHNIFLVYLFNTRKHPI